MHILCISYIIYYIRISVTVCAYITLYYIIGLYIKLNERNKRAKEKLPYARYSPKHYKQIMQTIIQTLVSSRFPSFLFGFSQLGYAFQGPVNPLNLNLHEARQISWHRVAPDRNVTRIFKNYRTQISNQCNLSNKNKHQSSFAHTYPTPPHPHPRNSRRSSWRRLKLPFRIIIISKKKNNLFIEIIKGVFSKSICRQTCR